jgi:hypothetical protein
VTYQENRVLLTPNGNRALRCGLGIPFYQHSSLSCSLYSEKDILNFDVTDVSSVADFDHDLRIVHVGICGTRSDKLRPISTHNDRVDGNL